MKLYYNIVIIMVTVLFNSICYGDNNIQTTTLELFDKTPNRLVPVAVYTAPLQEVAKQPVAIINHGYLVKNTEYVFLAELLVNMGYLVASIQHDLPTDKPLPRKGNIYEKRKPLWARGVQNISFVLQELQARYPKLDLKNLTLIGHSNGGDIAMLYATNHPVKNVISLDNLRMPLPKTGSTRILSLRASDTEADQGVLPTKEEQQQFGINIINLQNAKHADLCDNGSKELKQEVSDLIAKFLDSRY
jgi:hypothetical protein